MATKKATNWKVGSGLLDNFWMTIGSAWYGTDANYRGGAVTLFKVQGEAEIDDEVVDADHTIFYGMGDGWRAVKNGRAAEHPAGKVIFNKQSNAGRFVQAVLTLPGAKDAFEERGFEPYEADAWEGARFRFESKEFSIKDRETKETNTYDVSLPVEFGGFVDADETPAAGASKRGRRSAAKAEEVEAPKPSGRGRRSRGASGGAKDNGALRNSVVMFAADFEDDAHAEFVNAVFDPDEFPQAEELQGDTELSNDALEVNGSIWKASREVVPA